MCVCVYVCESVLMFGWTTWTFLKKTGGHLDKDAACRFEQMHWARH